MAEFQKVYLEKTVEIPLYYRKQVDLHGSAARQLLRQPDPGRADLERRRLVCGELGTPPPPDGRPGDGHRMLLVRHRGQATAGRRHIEAGPGREDRALFHARRRRRPGRPAPRHQGRLIGRRTSAMPWTMLLPTTMLRLLLMTHGFRSLVSLSRSSIRFSQR